MGKSHQAGSIVLRGKRWYGYYRKEVIDPTTDNVRVVRVVVRLGLKSTDDEACGARSASSGDCRTDESSR